jgi:putative flippase GtrA
MTRSLRFAAIGLINTALDFAIFAALTARQPRAT